VTPIGHITLPMTFRTQENFRTKYMQFEVADFKMPYIAFLKRPSLTKFMGIPHYAYLVLKIPGPNGIIMIKGDVKHTYDCDWESCETANMIIASVELQEFKKALAESPLNPIMLVAKSSKTSIQPEESFCKMIPLSPNEPSKVAHVGNSPDPK
jgi:hypothetical protein